MGDDTCFRKLSMMKGCCCPSDKIWYALRCSFNFSENRFSINIHIGMTTIQNFILGRMLKSYYFIQVLSWSLGFLGFRIGHCKVFSFMEDKSFVLTWIPPSWGPIAFDGYRFIIWKIMLLDRLYWMYIVCLA